MKLFRFLTLCACVFSYATVCRGEVVRFYAYGLGAVTATISHERKFENLELKDNYFQGEVKFTSHRYPLAARKTGDLLTLTFPGKATGERKKQRLFKVSIHKGHVNVSSVPSAFLGEAACAEVDSSSSSGQLPSVDVSNIQATETVKTITLEAFTDPSWVALYGSKALEEVANAVNTAEAIYNRQLGIRFKVLSITNLSESTLTTDPHSLLDEFRTNQYTQGTSNLKSLFTGKDMDGPTIGIAYIGVVCYAQKFTYNVIQSYGNLTGAVFAHEVGHNLGARHDFNAPGSLMYPSVSANNTGFSQQSLNEVTSFLGYFGSCLNTETMPPLLSGARLSVSKKGKTAVIKLVSVHGTPIGGTVVKILVKGKVTHRATSLKGSVTVPVKAKGPVSVVAVVKQDKTIVVRKTLRF